MTLPPGRNGLSARRMAVLYTFREPSLGRQVHREFMRSAWLDVTPIIPATACHQRNYVERYSRYMRNATISQPPPHPSLTFAVVAKVSDFQACLELTVWLRKS